MTTSKHSDNYLFRDDLQKTIWEQYVKEFPFRPRSIPLRPTRKQRLRYRWILARGYLKHLGLALVGRCDRDVYD